MQLNELIKDFVTENIQFECKARLNREDSLGWLKTVDGFANTKGGILFIGIEDKSYKVIGFEDNQLDKEKLYFYHEINEHFDINLNIQVDVIPYIIKDKKRYILKIAIEESNVKPVILNYKGMPLIYKRRDGFTSSVTSEELIDLSLNNKTAKYDIQNSKVLFNIEDFKKLQEFYYNNTGNKLNEKKLASIGFFDENKHLFKGSILFKDDYNENDTSIVCSIYEGLTRGDNKIIASNSFKGNLIDTLNYMYEFIILKMNKGFIKTETNHIDFDAFPKRSIYEALINAIVHRDYFIKGSAIYVDLFKNRLVITSPGSMFKNKEEFTTYNLDKLISSRRNELISSVFVLCNAMEAKGTGFEKIREDYKDADEDHKPFIINKYNQFSICLPDLTFKDGVEISCESLNVLKDIIKPSKYDLKILSYCFSNYKSIKEITSYLGISNSTFFRKNIIDNLLNQEFLLLDESSKEKKYISNHELVSKI